MGDTTYKESRWRRFVPLMVCAIVGSAGIILLTGVLDQSAGKRVIEGAVLLLMALAPSPFALRRARSEDYVRLADDGVHARDWLSGEWFVSWHEIRQISVGLDDEDNRRRTPYRFPLLELVDGTARPIAMLASTEQPTRPLAGFFSAHTYDPHFDEKIANLHAHLQRHHDGTALG